MESVLFWLLTALPYVATQYEANVIAQIASTSYSVLAYQNDYRTVVFIPYENRPQISFTYCSRINLKFELDTRGLRSLLDNFVEPVFFVFDEDDTAGFGRKELAGFFDRNEMGNISDIQSETKVAVTHCTDCISGDLVGKVGTWWDAKGKQWVTLGNNRYTDKVFYVSTDLKEWEEKNWLQDVDPYARNNAFDVFPIADVVGDVIWVILYPSKPDANGRSQLAYSTFVLNDRNQRYRKMGILDYSLEWGDVAVATGENKDHAGRNFAAVMKTSYGDYGYEKTMALFGGILSFSNGVLRHRFPGGYDVSHTEAFDQVSFLPNMDIFSCLPASRKLYVEAEFRGSKGGYGFRFFVNPDDYTQYGASFTVYKDSVSAERHMWLPEGMKPNRNEYTAVKGPFKKIGESVFVQVFVDVFAVQYFVYDGMYAGTAFVFPNPGWDRYVMFSDGPVAVSNMRVDILADYEYVYF